MIPRVARLAAARPRLTSATGPGTSVTMTDDWRSGRSKRVRLRPGVASVYALQDAVEAWQEMAGNQSQDKSHAKIVLRVAWHSPEYSSMTA